MATSVGPQRVFRPSDGFIDPVNQRYNFCPASLLPESFETPPKQLFEGDTGWFFQAGEIDWSPSVTAGLLQDFTRITAMLAKSGTKLVVVVPPPRALSGFAHLPAYARSQESIDSGARMRIYLSLLDRLRNAGPIVPDILAEARRQHVSFDRLTSPSDLHWSTTGAWVTSLAITRSITPHKLKDGVPPLVGTPGIVNGDSYTALLNKICGTNAAGQAVRSFTLAEPEAESGGDLLGGDDLLGGGGSKPPSGIVLVGTSFSALTHRYSFTPFIERYTGMPTLNLAIAGGGPLTSLKQYTESEDFRASKPKFLIWEFTSSGIPDTGFSSERGGILRGACAASYPIKTLPFRAGMKPVVTAADIARATSGDQPVQLELRSDNAAFKAFTVYYDYADGRQESIDLDTRRATTMDANYTLVLPDDHALISGISVVNDDPMTGQMTARLCPAVDNIASAASSPSWLGRVAAWFKSFWS